MKIEIKNLGPISKFTFDVEKDLHLIYGKNSVGKSYAIYCVYILLKKFNDISKIPYDSYDKKAIEYEKVLLESKIEILNKGKRIDIQKESFNEILIGHFNSIYSGEITRSFNNTFALDQLGNIYSKEKPEIKISSNGIDLILIVSELNEILVKRVVWNQPLEIFKETETKYVVYFGEKDFPILISHYDILLDSTIALIREIFTSGSKYLLNQIYFLPSSRSGLYLGLNSLAPIIAELSKYRFQLKNKIELPSLSEPISDYFLQLFNVNNKEESNEFPLIINQLEKDVLQGVVLMDNDKKRIIFQPKDSTLKLELSAASSMISEIAPIVTYLKYIINEKKNPSLVVDRRKTIIFIEEPEAHLHPEIQVRLMEIFAELTEKHNIKIVLTSHSNYMFNKLVNMILAKKVDVKKVVVNNMVMTKLGSVVDENMTVTEDGVEDFNFSQTSEKLYEERMNIVD